MPREAPTAKRLQDWKSAFDPFNKAIADECNNGITGPRNQMFQRERFRASGKVR